VRPAELAAARPEPPARAHDLRRAQGDVRSARDAPPDFVRDAQAFAGG